MDRADVALLALVIVAMGFSYMVTRRTLQRESSRIQKYKLYRMRDEFIYLVASGKFKSTDSVFKLFYETTNFLIGATDRINLRSFVAAIDGAREKGLDPGYETQWRRVHAELQTKDKDVIKAANEFYQSVMSILLENSFLLRIIIQWEIVRMAFVAFARLTRYRPPSRRAYWLYQDYDKAAHSIA